MEREKRVLMFPMLVDEDAMKFNYWYGYVDYYYAGAYYTYWHYGDVTVQ